MFFNVLTQQEQYELSNKFQNFNPMLFFKNLTLGLGLGLVFHNFYFIKKYIIDLIFHRPGVGKVNIMNLRKNKVLVTKTEVGDLRVPLTKMPSFDLSMGFFKEKTNLNNGFYDLDDLEIVEDFVKLSSHSTFWITDILNPMMLNGTKEATGFIISHIDSTIYIFKITDNDYIDYKKILDQYEIDLVEMDVFEKQEELSFNENSTQISSPEEEKNNVCCQNNNCILE